MRAVAELCSITAMRAWIYSLGHALTGGPPDSGFLPRIAHDPALAVLAEDMEPVARVRAGITACLRDPRTMREAEEEYARLYVGPQALPAPLWESVHLDPEHLLFGEITLEVRRYYARHGLSFAGRRTEPDDHIALELEFMWRLAARSGALLENGGSGDALASFVSLCNAQRDFLETHLLRWAPQSFALQLPHAHTDLYAGLARLIVDFLPSDAVLLAQLSTSPVNAAGKPCRKDRPANPRLGQPVGRSSAKLHRRTP
ncbi:MAG: molecular chaperone TorD family protein [Deltaproteobacteria bacterium]|nr:molecular chaperone TorD family protein [Deltaproteobacteria bacterium]